VNGVAYSPDGKTLVTAGDDGTLRLWDLATGQLIRTIKSYERLAFQVAFTPDGQLLVSCGAGPEIHLWDPATGASQGVLKGHTEPVEAIAISPNGKLLLSASSDGSAWLWDLLARKPVRKVVTDGHRQLCVAFSADGQRYAVGAVSGLITIGSTPDALTSSQLRQPDPVQSLTFLADPPRLAVGGRTGIIGIYPMSDGDRTAAGTAAPDTIAKETAANTVSRWLAHQGRVYSLRRLPDGQRIVSTGGDGRVAIWRPRRADVRWSLGGGDLRGSKKTAEPPPLPRKDGTDDHALRDALKVRNLSMDPNGRYLATANIDGPRVWDLQTRSLAKRLPTPRVPWNGVLLTADGKALIAGNAGGSLRKWDLATGQVTNEREFGDDISCIASSPATGQLAVLVKRAGSDDGIPLLDGAWTRIDWTFTSTDCNCLAFSPDGTCLAFQSGNDVEICNVASGQHLQTLSGHSEGVTGLAYRPQGDLLATVAADRRLKLWQTDTGKECFSAVAHTARPMSVTFSPDGQTFATGGLDAIVKLWDVATRQVKYEFPPANVGVVKVAFSPCGRRLVCLLDDTSVEVFDTAPTGNAP
jgi:WD40 repeat protein